jgi:cation transport ATPase
LKKQKTNTVVFDKTGTLTVGQVGVTDSVNYISNEEFLGYAVEQNSEHPIAKAIVKHANAKGTAIPKSHGFQAISGQGAKAEVNGKQVYVGGPRLLEKLNLSVTAPKWWSFRIQVKPLSSL